MIQIFRAQHGEQGVPRTIPRPLQGTFCTCDVV